MATVSTPQALSQSASVKVDGKAVKPAHRRIVSIRRRGYKMGCASDVDASGIGVGDRQGRSGLACRRAPTLSRLEADSCVALDHCLLHNSGWNLAPRRVRRLVRSLKRDICPAAVNRHADSPISMTSPRTALKRGQYAPLSIRSSGAPHATLPQPRRAVFLRRDLRQRADHYTQSRNKPESQ